MHHSSPLCQPYDPFTEQATIYSKVFLPSKIHLSLRPFHIAHDLPLINKWLNHHFSAIDKKSSDPFQYTEDYYTTLLATPNSQPLMGMIDQAPAFQADIYQAMLGPDKLIESTHLAENDFIMQLMMSPATMENLSLSTSATLACLDCIFQYAEVNRIIWMTNATEKNYRFIAGIAELDELNCDDYFQTYHSISKQRFSEIQYGLPLFPEERQTVMNY